MKQKSKSISVQLETFTLKYLMFMKIAFDNHMKSSFL